MPLHLVLQQISISMILLYYADQPSVGLIHSWSHTKYQHMVAKLHLHTLLHSFLARIIYSLLHCQLCEKYLSGSFHLLFETLLKFFISFQSYISQHPRSLLNFSKFGDLITLRTFWPKPSFWLGSLSCLQFSISRRDLSMMSGHFLLPIVVALRTLVWCCSFYCCSTHAQI